MLTDANFNNWVDIVFALMIKDGLPNDGNTIMRACEFVDIRLTSK
jgi:hypothetical protein